MNTDSAPHFTDIDLAYHRFHQEMEAIELKMQRIKLRIATRKRKPLHAVTDQTEAQLAA